MAFRYRKVMAPPTDFRDFSFHIESYDCYENYMMAYGLHMSKYGSLELLPSWWDSYIKAGNRVWPYHCHVLEFIFLVCFSETITHYGEYLSNYCILFNIHHCYMSWGIEKKNEYPKMPFSLPLRTNMKFSFWKIYLCKK